MLPRKFELSMGGPEPGELAEDKEAHRHEPGELAEDKEAHRHEPGELAEPDRLQECRELRAQLEEIAHLRWGLGIALAHSNCYCDTCKEMNRAYCSAGNSAERAMVMFEPVRSLFEQNARLVELLFQILGHSSCRCDECLAVAKEAQELLIQVAGLERPVVKKIE